MFGVNLARRSTTRGNPRPAVPPGYVVHAIGDIHGQLDLLVPLLERIVGDEAGAGVRPIVVCLGDYVDRGPSSRAVIDTLLALSALEAPEARFLLGNHESALLDFLEDPATGKNWFEQGGRETVASYGVSPRLAAAPDGWRMLRDGLSAALPQAHLDFLRRLEPAWEIGDYFFAHAGARPGVALEAQALQDLLWIRQPFLGDRRAFDKVVVHGHTPAEEVHVDHRRIGLDTGAYATGVLSAVRLEGDQRRIVQARRGLDGRVGVELRDI